VLPRRLGVITAPPGSTSSAPSGELVWVGAGSARRNDGKVALYFREDFRLAGPPPAMQAGCAQGQIHDAIRERLSQGPCFWLDLLELEGSAEELHEALWDLAWSGEVTKRRLRASASTAVAVRPARSAVDAGFRATARKPRPGR